jgi:hypothetical protein
VSPSRAIAATRLLCAVAEAVVLWGVALAQADPLLPVAPLEPERVHPSLEGKIPPFPPQPGKRRFVLFNHVEIGRPPRLVYMLVPNEFYGGDPGEPTRVWGLSLLLHYPDMTGPRNAKNAGTLGVCPGGCEGDMLVSVYNDIGMPLFGAEIRLANLKKSMGDVKPSDHTNYTEIPSDQFTKVIKETHGVDPRNPTNTLYFISMDRDVVSFFASCFYNLVAHICTAYANPQTTPGVEVQYWIRLENVENWRSVQRTVLSFVDQMVFGVFDYESVDQ